MGKKISLIDIAKSKFSDKKDLAEWYEKRLKICSDCKLNSANKPKSEQTNTEKAWVLANLGAPTCLACKCEISAKASLPHAVCGLQTQGLEPKWGEIVLKASASTLQIENISTTPVTITNDGRETIVDYGTLKNGADTDVQFLIRDDEDKMTDITAQASCGCTVPKLEKKGKVITLAIKYDTTRAGEFKKTVVLSYMKNNMKFEKVFKITGKIK